MVKTKTELKMIYRCVLSVLILSSCQGLLSGGPQGLAQHKLRKILPQDAFMSPPFRSDESFNRGERTEIKNAAIDHFRSDVKVDVDHKNDKNNDITRTRLPTAQNLPPISILANSQPASAPPKFDYDDHTPSKTKPHTPRPPSAHQRPVTLPGNDDRCDSKIQYTIAEASPVPLPGPRFCTEKRNIGSGMATLPPTVCDLCPLTPSGANPLDPCTCVGNSGSEAGLISIMCPPSLQSTEQLESLLATPDYLTTHVFRFTLKGSNVSGVIDQNIWGDLDFHQMVIEGNKFEHVDNKAFIKSANTLNYLSLYNNKIINYVTTDQDDLPNLMTLVLKRNRLTFIFSDAFKYASLKVLDLSYNQLSNLGTNAFAALNKLEEINMAHNQLTTLEKDSFNFYNHNPDSQFLQINLSYNKIFFIHNDAFPGLYNVQINLQGNQMTTLSKDVFDPIIVASQYYALFVLADNPIVCDCDILWVVEFPAVTSCFDNFICYDSKLPLYALNPGDLGNCTQQRIQN